MQKWLKKIIGNLFSQNICKNNCKIIEKNYCEMVFHPDLVWVYIGANLGADEPPKIGKCKSKSIQRTKPSKRWNSMGNIFCEKKVFNLPTFIQPVNLICPSMIKILKKTTDKVPIQDGSTVSTGFQGSPRPGSKFQNRSNIFRTLLNLDRLGQLIQLTSILILKAMS